MTPCPDANLLAELADGGLDDATRTDVERHLDDCAACTELLRELAWIIAPPPAAPPGYELGAPFGERSWQVRDATRTAAVTFGVRCDSRRAAIDHANVARVFATGERDGEPYVVHEQLTTTERAWRDAAPRDADAIVAVWRRVLDGLAALHAAGLVHGEVSPDRVFVEPDGRVVLGPPAGALAETSGYVAPECLNGAAASPASDQFAACASLWEALAGRVAFTGATIGALLVATSAPPEPPDDSADRRLAIVARGLAAAPAARFPDVAALAAALDHPPRRFRAVAVAIVLAVALAAIAIGSR